MAPLRSDLLDLVSVRVDAERLVPIVVDDDAVELPVLEVPSPQRVHGLSDERGGRAAGAEVDPRIDPRNDRNEAGYGRPVSILQDDVGVRD